jgi:hypothetical protein
MPNQTYYKRRIRNYRLELRKCEKEYNSLPKSYRREREKLSITINHFRHKINTAKIKLKEYIERKRNKPKKAKK